MPAFRIICLFIWIFISEAAWTQTRKWTVQQYDHGIVKITYTPENYPKNENISDAVILIPVKTENSLYFSDSTHLVLGAYHSMKELILSGVDIENRKGIVINLSPGEKIYGGGSRALPINRRGHSFDLDNRPWYGYSEGADNLNFSVPFFISSQGYGILFDNASRGFTDIGNTRDDEWNTTFSAGELNAFIIPGHSTAEILKKYHLLTGFQGLPPRWVLGNFLSRFGYTSEEHIKDISQKMIKEHIPYDAIIFDLFWFGDSIKGTMGNLDWVNRKKWPDPERMISDFKTQNIKTILITEPFILRSSQNYESSKHLHGTDDTGRPYLISDFYFGEAGLIDIFRKDARDWFWQKHEKQNKIGVAAWWGDLGEPEKHPKDMYHNLSDLGYKRLFSSDEVHNIYGHFWTKMLYENYEKNYPEARLFSLNRSGFAGSQRYSIFPWSGDVHRSWSGLRAQLPVMLGMSLSGIPYMHSDAGGFAMGDGDHELYIRWLQMSVFTPILRPHGSALEEMDKTSFSFPSEPALMPEPYKTRAREAIQLRYKMLPYNYNLAYLHTSSGRPLAAPLFFDYPDDKRVNNLENCYLWGSHMLIVPILDRDVQKMKVVLPEGKWYSADLMNKNQSGWFTSEAHIETSTHHIPVFVKEGSFIPMCDQNGITSEDFKTDSLWVQYYISDLPSAYTLFDDDGRSKNSIMRNEFELITFSAKPGKKSIVISIQSNGGQYPGQPVERHLTLQILGDNTYKKAITRSKRYKNKTNLNQKQTVHITVKDYPTKITLKK